jgi:hypothetical protein
MNPRNDCELLDRFAQSFARIDDLIYSHDQPPPYTLADASASDDWGIIRWKPARLAVPRDGLNDLHRVGHLPSLFEAFAESYAWLDVDLRVCRLFANPPAADLVALSNAMFADPVINNTLFPSRLVRFALASNCCYDPICFDLTRFDGDDCPIVRLEHESILMHDRIGKRETVFDSFRDFVLTVIDLGWETVEDRDRSNRCTKAADRAFPKVDVFGPPLGYRRRSS